MGQLPRTSPPSTDGGQGCNRMGCDLPSFTEPGEGRGCGETPATRHADPPCPAFGHVTPSSKAVSSPAAVWDTHKYIKERGLKIVLDDFILQVLLNAILGLKGRQETRKLLSALIRN